MVVNGFNSSPPALRELIFCSAMVVPGTISYAHQVFAEITEPDTFMYNTMIRGSAQSQTPVNAISLYTQMDKGRVKPDNFTFSFVLKACTKVLYRNMGFCVHGKVVKHGFEVNKFARNTLIYFHANCGDLNIAKVLFDDPAKRDVVAWSALTAGCARRGELSVARSLFDEMPVRDLVSWNVMITGYVKQGEMEKARELFNEVPERDVVTWNAMIAGYVRCGLNEFALEMFEEMRSVGGLPDEVTMLSLLSACRDLRDLEVGEKVHSAILEMSYGEMNVLLGNALIDMYAKCGSIETAMEVFRGMREKDVSTWNSVIGGLAFHGHAEESNALFSEMQRMEIEPNAIIWRTLLGACRIHGNVELGRRANERLLEMRKDESGDYVLLSNIYASRGEWDGAQDVRKLMDDSGALGTTFVPEEWPVTAMQGDVCLAVIGTKRQTSPRHA
ncbi:hypothetical protein Q3G72_033893 [Acer saccharum]|nr:hypothetical protein Q3G72_033893 [Acer saccharum]